MEVCPTEVIHAPAERIWQLLIDPRELAQWSGTKLLRAPARAVRTGDLLVLRTGVMHVAFEVLDAEPPQSLRLYVRLPFGVVNHEHVQITPVGSGTCRVTFN
jgi:uncharacterized protein YndB with AHSA1/START domain